METNNNADKLYWENQKFLKMLDMIEKSQTDLDEEKRARIALAKKSLLTGGVAAALAIISQFLPPELQEVFLAISAVLTGVGIIGGGVIAHGSIAIKKAEGYLNEMKTSTLDVYNILKDSNGLMDITDEYLNKICNLIREKTNKKGKLINTKNNEKEV